MAREENDRAFNVAEATEGYWAYVHDGDGDILEDLGNFDDLNPAITAACDKVGFMFTDDMMRSAVRVVENKTSTTVWMAGPIKFLSDDEDNDSEYDR